MTAEQAIQLLTDEAERQNATANDESGTVRAIVTANLPGRPDAQFNAWFSVCCELATRAAKRLGYESEVARAYRAAEFRIHPIHCEHCGMSASSVHDTAALHGNLSRGITPICCEYDTHRSID